MLLLRFGAEKLHPLDQPFGVEMPQVIPAHVTQPGMPHLPAGLGPLRIYSLDTKY